MKIARLNLDDLTRTEQLEKMQEEFEEFEEAFSEKTEEDLVEELWDLIQASFGLLFKILPTLFKFRASYTKHLIKMRRREQEKRISVDEWEIL